jgi:hypothetical protein
MTEIDRPLEAVIEPVQKDESTGFKDPKYEHYYNKVISQTFDLFTDTIIDNVLIN